MDVPYIAKLSDVLVVQIVPFHGGGSGAELKSRQGALHLSAKGQAGTRAGVKMCLIPFCRH